MATSELIQIIGALLNMGGFALLHFEIAPSSALRYLIPNWVGSVLLVGSAYVDHQWGFFMLESAWVLTGSPLMKRPRSESRADAWNVPMPLRYRGGRLLGDGPRGNVCGAGRDMEVIQDERAPP